MSAIAEQSDLDHVYRERNARARILVRQHALRVERYLTKLDDGYEVDVTPSAGPDPRGTPRSL